MFVKDTVKGNTYRCLRFPDVQWVAKCNWERKVFSSAPVARSTFAGLFSQTLISGAWKKSPAPEPLSRVAWKRVIGTNQLR